MVFNESDELFELRQQFFTGQYDQVSNIDLEDFTGDIKDLAKFYKLRSLVLLGKQAEALSILIGEAESTLNKTLQLYIDFTKGSDVSKEFESTITSFKKNGFVQILGSLYLVKNGKVDEAIELLHHHEDSLENVLFLVQLYLYQNKLELAKKELTNASPYANDSIIYNLAEGYYNSVSNGENLRGALYFFEELSHTNPTFKTLLGQFVLNLQLHQIPEAEVVLEQLHELDGTNADLIANEIAYYNIIGDLDKVEAKRAELVSLGSHPVLDDYEAKNKLFDEVIEKYSSQITNN